MAPIPIRPPKGANPLPLEATLSDLAALRSRSADLLALLSNPPDTAPASKEIEQSLERSYEFVRSTRRAMDVDVNVAVQGERIEAVRAALADADAGFERV